ncbi:MAG: sensor histidine kinase [Acidimicrobiales bacterium]
MNVLAGRPRVQDAVLAGSAAAFAVAAVAFDLGDADSHSSPLAFVLVAVAGIGLLARRRSPMAVLGVVVVARLIMTWDTGNDVALIPAAMIALYTVTRTGDRRRSLAVAVSAAVVMMVAVAALNSDEFVQELASEAALMFLPIAVGDAARSRADRIRVLIDTEAAARVQAERFRIARDLHDVVAHGLSTIAIQSGVAAHLVERDPRQAKESLEIINATGKHALEELRSMVGVLRSTDEEVPLRPTPSDPDDLSDLLAGAANAGLTVTTELHGGFPPDVGDACIVAMHRIIQEALTNVARHAGQVAVDLVIHHGVESVRVQIVNDPGSSSAPGSIPSTGVGVIGMTERAEALGGTLRAQKTAVGGFEVDARIPYHRRISLGEQP